LVGVLAGDDEEGHDAHHEELQHRVVLTSKRMRVCVYVCACVCVCVCVYEELQHRVVLQK
jgi:hypothetical protein